MCIVKGQFLPAKTYEPQDLVVQWDKLVKSWEGLMVLLMAGRSCPPADSVGPVGDSTCTGPAGAT